jgi:PAS domain S-box-containing protein
MNDSIRILHVDDDPKFRDMTAKFLRQESEQFELIGESHGVGARERLKDTEEKIDCVVSDYVLPDLNGVELLDAVRNEYPDLPFVLFTGKGSEAVARDALRAGATDYLQKQSGTQQYDLLANRIENAVDQVQADQRVTELERVRTLVADISQALVHSSSKEEIETRVCDLFAESAPYVTACIAGVDTETMRAEPRTWAGADQACFEQFDMEVSADASGRHAPGGRAYHDRGIAVSQDIENDPRYEQWCDAALEQGWKSLAVVPLEYESELYGLLAIFASRPHAFGESEQRVLTELGNDIAHALHNQAVEAELERTTREFRTLFEHIPAGTALVDYEDGTFRYRRFNPSMEELSDISKDKIRNKTPREVWGGTDGRVVEARYRECVERGEPVEYTSEFEISGEQVVRSGTVVPVKNGGGIGQLVVVVRDITEKTRRKREREENEHYRQKLYEITSSDRDDREKLQRLLELGCERLDVGNGLITRIDLETNRHEVELAGESDFVQAGTVTELESTYCRKAADSEDVLTVDDAIEEGWKDDSAYERWEIGCYIGGCIEVNDEFYGTLCFADRSPRKRDFSQSEQTFVDLMTRWVSHVFERRHHQRHLRQYETVINAVPDGVYVLDDTLELTMVNDGLVELTGYPRKELVGSHVSLIVDEETIERGQQNRKHLRDGRSEHEYLSTEIETASGETVPTEIKGTLLNPDSEASVTTAGVVRDVTEQRERERRLATTTARLETLFERSPDMIHLLDSTGRIVRANSRFYEKLGYEKDEVEGNGIWTVDQRVGEGEVLELLSDLDVGSRQKFEGQGERHDGSTFPVEVHLLRLDLEGNDRFMAISRDITERKEQERKREQTISRVTDAIVEVDSDWRFTLINDQAKELYGMQAAELLGQHQWDVFSEARGTRFEDEYREAMETREPTSLVEYYAGLDGWFDVQVYPTDSGGLAFYFREVTERQRRQRRFEAVFNNTYQFTWFLDPDGTLLEANDTVRSFGGVDREEVVGKPFWETYWFQASEKARETAKRAVEQARDGEMFRDEVRVRGTDREAVIDFIVRPVTDEQGTVTSLIPEGYDITERKEREQELAESEARYRALAENFPNGGVFLFDENLRYQIVSGIGFDHIDTSPEDLIGNTIYEISQYSQEGIEMLEPVMEATLAGTNETIEVSYEGHIYKLRAVPIRDEDGTVIAGLYITQDITDQRQRENELERQNERLEQFASIVSHDLRNPLNMVEGRLKLAQNECNSEDLVEAEAALDRCQTLIDDLLSLAREGQSVAETEPIDVAEVVERGWSTVETSQATLHTDIDRTIVADRSRLRQLFENLIRNSIEHGETSVTITVGDVEDGFYVEDDGPGIPGEIRDEVFESAYSTIQDNTGFGLAIVKKIVDAHGWDISIGEASSGGARFEITGVENQFGT